MRWGPWVAIVVLVGVLPSLIGLGVPGHAVGAGPPAIAKHPLFGATRPSPGTAGSLLNSWPTYLQNPERTGANLGERTLAVTNASNVSILWKVKTNGSGFGSPTVVNGTVYAGSWDGYEYALNASTGHILWKAKLGTDPNCSWGNPMGVAGNAAVWNGTVFVGGGDDFWYALNAVNGSVLWRLKVGDNSPSGGNYNWASPLLYRGYEYIGIASCIDSPLVQGKLLMVNLTGTHSVVHTFDFVPNGQAGGTIWTTSAVDPATGLIWVATGNDGGTGQKLAQAIVALDASNLTLVGHWQVPGVQGTDSDFGAGPTLFNDSHGRPLVASTNKNGVLYALNRSNVTENGSWRPVWSLTTSGGFAPGAFDGSTLYAAGGGVTLGSTYYAGSVRALDPTDGSVTWTHGTSSFVYAGLAYANGLVVDGSGSVLELLDASTGTLLKGLSIASGQTINGAPSIAQGRIFFESGDFSTTGYIYAAGLSLGFSANETPATGVAPLAVRFAGAPTGGMPPYNLSWAFGDGLVGFGSPIVHRYFVGGTFNISVQLRDAANGSQSASLQVVVGTPLNDSIIHTPATGAAPFNATFTGSAQFGAGGPYNFTWGFSDGSSPGFGVTVRHEFLLAGTYAVALEARDVRGDTANATDRVVVGAPLTVSASASPLTGIAPLQVRFTSMPTNGTAPYRFAWNFGDQTPFSTQGTVYHVFAVPGNFTTTLTVWDATNAQRTRTLAIRVGAPLTGQLSTPVQGSEACPAHSIEVTFHGFAAGGVSPYSYSWVFGDGTVGSAVGASVSHNYTANGTYTSTLTVQDSAGNVTTVSTSTSIVLAACPGTGHGPPTTTPPPTSSSPWGGSIAWIGAAVIVGGGLVVAGAWVAVRRKRSRQP